MNQSTFDHEKLQETVRKVFPVASWEFDAAWNGASCKLPWPNQTIEVWDQVGIADYVDVTVTERTGPGMSRTIWNCPRDGSYEDLEASLLQLRAYLQEKSDAATAIVQGLAEILPMFKRLPMRGPDGSEIMIDNRIHPQIGVIDDDGEVLTGPLDTSDLLGTGPLGEG